jgi:alpha-amylase
MFTAGGSPGEVHSYFSPFNNPMDAFVTAQAAILDFENRIRLAAIVADEPFLFYTGVGEKCNTGTMTWSLRGFTKAIKNVALKSVEFHNSRGDFEQLAEKSLHDTTLSKQLKREKLSELSGEPLREAIIKDMKKAADRMAAEMRSTTKYF